MISFLGKCFGDKTMRFWRYSCHGIVLLCMLMLSVSCRKTAEPQMAYEEGKDYLSWYYAVRKDTVSNDYFYIPGYRKPSEEQQNNLSILEDRLYGFMYFNTVDQTILRVDSIKTHEQSDYTYLYYLSDESLMTRRTIQKIRGMSVVDQWTHLQESSLSSDTLYSQPMIRSDYRYLTDIEENTDVPKALFSTTLYELKRVGNRLAMPVTSFDDTELLSYYYGEFYEIRSGHWKVMKKSKDWKGRDIRRLYDYYLDQKDSNILHVIDDHGMKKHYYLGASNHKTYLRDIMDNDGLLVEVLSPVYSMSFEESSRLYVQGESIGKSNVIKDVDEYIQYKFPYEYTQKPLFEINDFGKINGGGEIPLNYRIYGVNPVYKESDYYEQDEKGDNDVEDEDANNDDGEGSGDEWDEGDREFLLLITGVYNGELYVVGEQYFRVCGDCSLDSFEVQGKKEYWMFPIYYHSKTDYVFPTEEHEKYGVTEGGFRLKFSSLEGDTVNMQFDFGFDWDYVRHSIRPAMDKYHYTWVLTSVERSGVVVTPSEIVDLRFRTVTFPFAYSEDE